MKIEQGDPGHTSIEVTEEEADVLDYISQSVLDFIEQRFSEEDQGTALLIILAKLMAVRTVLIHVKHNKSLDDSREMLMKILISMWTESLNHLEKSGQLESLKALLKQEGEI